MTTTDLVQIETLSIEAKVIVIGKKQVTLSVFRQLKERSIFPITIKFDCELPELLGIPWGVVYYTWGGKSDSLWYGKHLVWQEGNELFRMPLPKEGYVDKFLMWSFGFEKYEGAWETNWSADYYDGDLMVFTDDGTYDVESTIGSAIEEQSWFDRNPDTKLINSRSRARKELNKLAKIVGLSDREIIEANSWNDLADQIRSSIIKAIRKADAAMEDFKVRVVERLGEFDELDQLFIAV